jgi:cytochrome P450
MFQIMDDDSTSKLWTSTVAGLILIVLAYYWMLGKRSKISYDPPLPPLSEYGFFETLQHFSSTKFHEWSLKLARTRGRIVEINFWPLLPRETFYTVNDPVVARKILENPKSMKPREVYDLFDGLVGGVCFISEEGERYKHPRKSILMGISHANLDDMMQKLHRVMDRWIDRNLGKEEGEIVNVDIGAEMQKATIHSIGMIAFGYEFSTEEQEITLSKMVKAAYEFGIASEKNPLRKHPLIGLLWAAKRDAIRCVQDIRSLVHKVLEVYRSKTMEEKKKIVVLDSLNAPGKYDKIGGEEALISDMILLYMAGFDTSKFRIWRDTFS